MRLAAHPRFNVRNQHLDLEQRRALILRAEWPGEKPVYSPYFIRHGGYNSIKIARKSYMTHRVAFMAEYDVDLG